MDVTRFDIKFDNLSYHVEEGIFRKTKKAILKDVSGDFRFKELTGIIGTSGSGKTSLLNVLSGFISKNVHGELNVKRENKNGANIKFIMQEENFFTHLTVFEAMNFSLKFKTGNRLNVKMRDVKIRETLESFNLCSKLDECIGALSGGERKKLSIAMELLDDPKIIFLDEVTSGLDYFSSTQCIKLLKQLASQGKTVVCTIHQPSASIVKIFDHIYVLADGKCAYQGAAVCIVPFLSRLNFVCPQTYTPADYLLEIINGDVKQKDALVRRSMNGKSEEFRGNLNNNNNNNDSTLIDTIELQEENSFVAPTFLFKLVTLMERNYILARRDKSNVLLRICVHLLVAIFIGIMFHKSGNNADNILNNFKYLFLICGFLAYSHFYSLLVKFPLDLCIIKREHFNQNYSTLAYYLSTLLSDAPVTIFCSSIFVSITHFMTDQPTGVYRFSMILLFCIIVSFIAQSYGVLIGSSFELKSALIIAAILMALHILFSGFIVLEKDVSPYANWIFQSIYLRHALRGITTLTFGYDRGKMTCDKIYCHFQQPQKFLDLLEFDEDLTSAFIAFFVSIVVLNLMSFFVIKYRLKH